MVYFAPAKHARRCGKIWKLSIAEMWKVTIMNMKKNLISFMSATRWLKRNFGRNWWATRHITSDIWFPMQFRSVFGVPMSTMFFSVAGPFERESDVRNWIANNYPEQYKW